MSEDIVIRPNICDHIVETEDGSFVLLKDPVDWQDGEVKRTSIATTKGIDIKALCALLCQESGADEITFNQMYKVCEVVLQMEESGKEVFPK